MNAIVNQKELDDYAQSEYGFPIPFEWAWRAIGYSRKFTAERALLDNFQEGSDFLIPKSEGLFHINVKKSPVMGRPETVYMLSADCFKAFCMMAGTAEGREVRLYFIEAEKRLRRIERGLHPDGGIPERAKKPQISGGENLQMISFDTDLTDALWLYSIGAIGRADVYRFRFGAAREPSAWELSIDPLRLTYTVHIAAARKILAMPDGGFPLPGPELARAVCGDSTARGVWLHNSDHTRYEGQKTFSREACQFLCDRWFDTGHEEEMEFRRLEPLNRLYQVFRREREAAPESENLPPVYLWHRLGNEQLAELRTGYFDGLYDARRVRQLLFGDQLAGIKNALPPPAERFLIAGVSYEDALAKIDDAYKSMKQITPAGIARACGLPQKLIESAQRQTRARKRQTMKLAEARLALEIAYNRGGGQ